MLRRFKSLRPRTSASVIPPFTASAASEVQIIHDSMTSTGARKRCTASHPSHNDNNTNITELVNAASTPARR